AEEIETADGSAKGWVCDVTDKERVEAVIAEVVADFGGVDVLVNNAGLLSGRRPFMEVDKAEMLRYFETNVVGYLHMAQVTYGPGLFPLSPRERPQGTDHQHCVADVLHGQSRPARLLSRARVAC